MSYTPTEWVTGDVITAEKLNNIEQGIVDGERLVITATNVASASTTQTEPTLDKTFAEIVEAIEAGKVPVLKMVVTSGFVYLANNASIMYSGDDVMGIVFSFTTSGAVNNLWHIENYDVNIFSDAVMSKFIQTDLSPAS